MSYFKLALRLLWRDARSGELTILLMALIIAVTSSTAISLFSDRLQGTMNQQAADFMAADLLITSPTKVANAWLEKAQQLNLKAANGAEFSTMLIENDQLLLSSLKAVSQHYPLRGYLKTRQADYQDEQKVYSGPKVGKVWVDQRVLTSLNLSIGEPLQVGELSLTISRILSYEPDKSGTFYSLSPRVMIHTDDLVKTAILQAGSRVQYLFQFSGEEAAIKQFSAWLDGKLSPSQRLLDVHDNRPEIGAALERAERYLGLSSILVILIAGVAIAMAARRYTERHFNATAILRCLGCQQNQVLSLYGIQILVVGLVGSSIGCLLGWFAQYGLFYLLADLLPSTIASASLLALIIGFITGLVTLLGFALPPLLRLKKVSPLRVLRRELEPLSSSAWLVYGLAASIIAGMVWYFTQDLILSLIIIGVGFVTLSVLAGLIIVILIAVKRFLPRLNLSWRLGVQELVREPKANVGQILAFSITLLAMLLSFTVRNDLLKDWQNQLPVNAANYFAINIFPEQVADLRLLFKQKDIPTGEFYPVVRGRLISVNDQLAKQIVTKDSVGERSIQRDLSLTWSSRLPEGNEIIAGNWQAVQSSHQVSIEQELAESLNASVGDKLGFTIRQKDFTAVISSIRKVQWDNMKPNFYLIFSSGTLDSYPSTFITSFYLSEKNKPALNQLLKEYPSMTVLEVEMLLKQFEKILAQLTQAIDYLLLFALLAGISVLFASIYASLDARVHTGALLRTLGANRKLLKKSQFIEFATLGFIASLLAIIAKELISYFLYQHVFHLSYQANYWVWLVMPVMVSISLGFAGMRGLKRVITSSPVQVLRDL